MHTLTVNNGFTASYTEKAIGVDITILHISAKNDVPAWWETYDGYAPLHVPDEARSPLYSA